MQVIPTDFAEINSGSGRYRVWRNGEVAVYSFERGCFVKVNWIDSTDADLAQYRNIRNAGLAALGV